MNLFVSSSKRLLGQPCLHSRRCALRGIAAKADLLFPRVLSICDQYHLICPMLRKELGKNENSDLLLHIMSQNG